MIDGRSTNSALSKLYRQNTPLFVGSTLAILREPLCRLPRTAVRDDMIVPVVSLGKRRSERALPMWRGIGPLASCKERRTILRRPLELQNFVVGTTVLARPHLSLRKGATSKVEAHCSYLRRRPACHAVRQLQSRDS